MFPKSQPEPPKPIAERPLQAKKEEKPMYRIEPMKPPLKLENKMEIPKTSPAPRVEYKKAVFPEPPKIKFEKPKEEINKIPQNAIFQHAEINKIPENATFQNAEDLPSKKK